MRLALLAQMSKCDKDILVKQHLAAIDGHAALRLFKRIMWSNKRGPIPKLPRTNGSPVCTRQDSRTALEAGKERGFHPPARYVQYRLISARWRHGGSRLELTIEA